MISVVLDFEVCRCTFRHFDNTVLAFPAIDLQRCFNLEVHDGTRNYVYHLGTGPQPGLTVDNNLVFGTWAEAGLVDTKTFMPSDKSPVKNAATGRIGYIIKDHYNHDRYVGAIADVGAVEGEKTVP